MSRSRAEVVSLGLLDILRLRGQRRGVDRFLTAARLADLQAQTGRGTADLVVRYASLLALPMSRRTALGWLYTGMPALDGKSATDLDRWWQTHWADTPYAAWGWLLHGAGLTVRGEQHQWWQAGGDRDALLALVALRGLCLPRMLTQSEAKRPKRP